jgi:hypothetical protein
MDLRRLRVIAFGLVAACCATVAMAYERERSFDRLEQSLRLNPIQQQQFDIAVKATQRALLSIGLGALQMKTALGRELLKDRPDPRALELAQDELVEMSRPHVRAAKDEWLRFYSLLDDEQVGIARALVEEKLRQMERLAEHLSRYLTERLQQP